MRWRGLLRVIALAAAPAIARAQRVATIAVAPSGRPAAVCHGQRVDNIIVYTSAPTVANLARVPWLQSLVRSVHVTTQPQVVERYLLLAPGDACDELRRAESERILRAQPFIVEAEVFVVANEAGGVDLEVRTSDETAGIIGGSVRARSPMLTSVLLGNANVNGEGIYTNAAWSYGDGFRDSFAARVSDHQFLGRPWIFAAEGERGSLGGTWKAEAAHPYLTDLQRVAWRARVGQGTDYEEMRRPEGDAPFVSLTRAYFDVGAIGRIGPPGRMSLVGLSFTGERNDPGNRLLSADSGVIRDLGPTPVAYSNHRVGRANLLLGARNIAFVRIAGLDALTATQDLPTGLQVSTQVGRSIHLLGATEEDVALAGDLYMGATNGRSTTRLQLQGEGRRTLGQPRWDDVLTTGRLTHYLQVAPQQLNTTVLEWSGGYRERIPFQLQLGMPAAGVRGYEESSLVGGSRIVLRTEQRYVFPAVLRQADVGIAMFGDAGRQWAGDVPYGVTTPVKTSVGISLIATVPPRSSRLWRADIAFPLNGGADRHWTLRFTNADRTAFEFRAPNDIADRRALNMPTSLFAWP